MSKKPEVLIAVMSVDGRVYANVMRTLMQWTGNHEHYSCNKVVFMQGLRPLPTARNSAVQGFLNESGCDYLLQWDHDILAPKGALEQLIKDEKDIVSANCLMMQVRDGVIADLGPASWRLNKANLKDGYHAYWGDDCDRVDTVTGGFFMVHRRVYEKMGPPWFSYGYDKWGKMKASCEIFFAQKAQQHGFELHTDYRVLCDHVNYARYVPILSKLYLVQEVAKGRKEEDVIKDIHETMEGNGTAAKGLREMYLALEATNGDIDVLTEGNADDFHP